MSEYEFQDPAAAEDAPLLGPKAPQPADADGAPKPDTEDYKAHAAWYQAKSQGQVIALVSAIFFCLVLSAIMALMPMFRLMEDIVCRRYYDTPAPVDEKLCKVDEVQAKLAWFGGVAGFLDSIASMLNPPIIYTC